MKSSRATLAVFVAVIALAACGHRGAVPYVPNQSQPNEVGGVALSIVHTPGSRFWEYTLPAGLNPRSLANGPNGTVWFTGCNGTANLYRLSASTGSVMAFQAPVSYSGACEIGSVGGYFLYTVQNNTDSTLDLARVTPTGAFSFFDTDINGAWGISNITAGSDGRAWLGVRFRTGACRVISGVAGTVESFSTTGASGPVTRLAQAWVCPASVGCFCIGYYEPIALAEASDKNFYVTAYYAGAYNGGIGFAVFKMSTAASILNKFLLPGGSTIASSFPFHGALPIAAGPDGRLWIGEPGLNSVARMTTSGAFTQFRVPTASAGISHITDVPGTIDSSSALWFTESSSNKIARVTTSGTISEYTVPTASGHPGDISPCPATVCGLHGGVWFTENGVNRVARYDFP